MFTIHLCCVASPSLDFKCCWKYLVKGLISVSVAYLPLPVVGLEVTGFISLSDKSVWKVGIVSKVS